MFKSYNKYEYPLEMFNESSLMDYVLQLNTYAFMAESIFNKPVRGIYIYHFYKEETRVYKVKKDKNLALIVLLNGTTEDNTSNVGRIRGKLRINVPLSVLYLFLAFHIFKTSCFVINIFSCVLFVLKCFLGFSAFILVVTLV